MRLMLLHHHLCFYQQSHTVLNLLQITKATGMSAGLTVICRLFSKLSLMFPGCQWLASKSIA